MFYRLSRTFNSFCRLALTSLVMEPKLGWIIVTVLVLNKISFVSNVWVNLVGSFHQLHRHPMLNRCADKILKENQYVGGRVHVLTGECEGLNRSWVLNQTVQSGYAYTKKVSVKESYIPPLENNYIAWTIPGVLREGATVAATLEVPPDGSPDYSGFVMYVLDSVDYRRPDQFDWEVIKGIDMKARVETGTTTEKFLFCEYNDNGSCFIDTVCTPPQITKGMKSKISLRAHTGSIELLVDDHEICMVKPAVDLTTLKMVLIGVSSPVILHGVEFIDA